MCGAHVFTCLRSPCLAEGGDGGGDFEFHKPLCDASLLYSQRWCTFFADRCNGSLVEAET